MSEMKIKKDRKIARYFIDRLMLIFLFIYIFPTLIIINLALKTQKESVLTEFFQLPQKLQFGNFITVFKESQLATALINSTMLALGTIVVVTVLTSMTSYIIARKKSVFSDKLFYYFMINYFVPGEASIIAVMKLMGIYKLYGHISGLIILYTSGAAAMAIFLFSSYIKSIPEELDEAATVDGADMFRFFWQILFPLMKPIVATQALLLGIAIYNDLLTPMLILNTKARTVTLEIYSFVSQFSANYPLAFSGIIISSIPIIIAFFAAQKYIVSGLTAGIVKG